MRNKFFSTFLIGVIFYSCNVNNAIVSKKIVNCIDDNVNEKRESWGFNTSQNTEETFLNFEKYLLIKGYIKSNNKEDYRKFVDEVVTSPENYIDIYNHLYNYDQYLDTSIIFSPDFVLLYCPSNILEKEENDILSKQLKIMQNVLDTNYGDKKSVNQLFKITSG